MNKETNSNKSRTISFKLGEIVATPGVLEVCNQEYLTECLARHAKGDWGNVPKSGARANSTALKIGFRLVSAYAIDPTKPAKGYGQNCFWIITEADRSVTTFLLPREY